MRENGAHSEADMQVSGSRRRVHVRVTGTVQGVGFRPHVFRVAGMLQLGGFVRNDPDGLVVELEGSDDAVRSFLDRLAREVPPLAIVGGITVEERPVIGRTGEFAILESRTADAPSAVVAPDTATCPACLVELFDPRNRRFRYPFINCTHCGPRFTIVREMPYDRPRTSMAGFAMCGACRAEYEDPADRRCHAQPIACPACGPSVRFTDPHGRPVTMAPGSDAVLAAAEALRQGAIIAVKGVGGFHLACRASDDAAVERLRLRKGRRHKPFALMAADLATARRLVELDAAEERLLASRQRPIVLARRRTDAPVAPAVAPRQRDLGVMLPYAPLHHLLLRDVDDVLVMTSGNVSDEPIVHRDDDALERLASIADFFLLHDRPIEQRADDSVARVVTLSGSRRTLMVRRARGYVPELLGLPVSAPAAVLATGSQQKSTLCVVRGDRAWIGPHLGDLDGAEARQAYEEAVPRSERLFGVEPRIVAHDLHPDYVAARYARERRAELEPEPVQHHHAHFAACLAEHGRSGPALGVIFDGTGYGIDGTIWGGEILYGDLGSFERVGHLHQVRMPGGAAAVREPWRMACAWLSAASGGAAAMPTSLDGVVDPASWRAVSRLIGSGVASPMTSSVGRLLDGVASLCGVRARTTYEGQAAIELEAIADTGTDARYPVPILARAGSLVLDARPLVRSVIEELAADAPLARISAAVHNGLAHAAARACVLAAEHRDVNLVALSGGVFQNVLLLERTAARLEREGFRVLVPERLPPNDGGLSYGQAAVAAFRACGRAHGLPRHAAGRSIDSSPDVQCVSPSRAR